MHCETKKTLLHNKTPHSYCFFSCCIFIFCPMQFSTWTLKSLKRHWRSQRLYTHLYLVDSLSVWRRLGPIIPFTCVRCSPIAIYVAMQALGMHRYIFTRTATYSKSLFTLTNLRLYANCQPYITELVRILQASGRRSSTVWRFILQLLRLWSPWTIVRTGHYILLLAFLSTF